MFDNEKSIFDYKVSPIYMAVGIIVLFVISILGYHFCSWTSLIERDIRNYWILSGSFTLLYSMSSSVMLLPQEKYTRYYGHAIIGFIMIAVVSGCMAYVFSGVGMDEAGSFRWLYVLFLLCFLIFMGIARFIKRIVKITQNENNY